VADATVPDVTAPGVIVPGATRPRTAVQTPRERLIDAAAELFYRQGACTVGVDLVSAAAGVSKRTLYQQFGSKDRLIAEALDAKGPEVLSRYLPDEASAAPPRSVILSVFERLTEWTSGADFRGCPFINTATELADAGHPARNVAANYNQRLRDYLAGQAERAGAKAPRLLSDQLIVLFDGVIVQAVFGTPTDPSAVQAAVTALLDVQGAR
jgi:AcrR family transcriptional regulator